jgi:hypothetical protein
MQNLLPQPVYRTADLKNANTGNSLCDEGLMAGPDSALLSCPQCGAAMNLFESFPARSGLPEVHVFECVMCKEMILQDRTRHAAATHAGRSRLT